MPDAAGDESVVGFLALQGDFAEHVRALASHGLATREVRVPVDLDRVDALVLPGGESTTMLKLLADQRLEAPLLAKLRSGIPVLATCAGLILLARTVTHPSQRSFGLIDVTVARNGYGRQIASGTFRLQSARFPALEGVFIRAPRITAVGPEVEVLAWRGADPCLVRQGSLLGAVFHPELQTNHPVTALFAEQVSKRSKPLHT